VQVQIDPGREHWELRTYLGDRYDHSRLERWEQVLDEEYDRIGDEAALYRSSEAYLYNLTAFAMSRTKEPYLRDLTELVKPPAVLLDYGCGIGSDGLALIESGYRVGFADFDNPSTRYLRWRLRERGLEAEIYDLDREEVPTGFDAAYAFDVIEHVQDPFELLARLEAAAELVAVNFLDPIPEETVLHHPLPVKALVAHAAKRGLRRYRRYHQRSHLVLYEPVRSRALGGLRSRLALWNGRIRAAG
jgi:Methyltransferase domain